MLLRRRHAPRLLLRRGGVRRRGFGGKPPPPPVPPRPPPRPSSRPQPEGSAKRSSIVAVPEATSSNGWERGWGWQKNLGHSLRWGLFLFAGWGLLRWAPWASPAATRAPAGAEDEAPRERERVYPLDTAYSLGAHQPQHALDAPSLAPLTLDEVSSTALGFVQEHALRQALRCLAALRPT
eukprot:COSAG04_NODE_6250_length_1373_cov_1.465463_1_plen_179_part_10